MTKPYILRYFKSTALLCLGIALPISLLLLISALIADVLAYDIYISLIPIAIAIIITGISMLKILSGKRLVSIQENALHTVFNDNNAKEVAPHSLIYLSDDWLIVSGRYAFHRHYISAISVKPQNKYNTLGGYYCMIRCKNERTYRVFVRSTSDSKEIKSWYNTAD
ncbi:MAG: hypothetical protein IJW62_04420 [Clostridia bacterium]|nr:hypothetical protein [Clostridia bacterium]